MLFLGLWVILWADMDKSVDGENWGESFIGLRCGQCTYLINRYKA